jgi:hypothetical protein
MGKPEDRSMAKRRNPKPKNITELGAVEQSASSVEVPLPSEPVAAMEDQAPVPTEATSELPAIGEAPPLAAESSPAVEPAVALEADAAPTALAAAKQPVDAEVTAMDAQTVIIERAPAIHGPAAAETMAEPARPPADAPVEVIAPAAAAMVPIGRNRPYFARAASIALAAAVGAVIGSLVPMVLIPAAEPVNAEVVQPDGLRATNASVDRLAAEVATLKATLAARAVAAPPVPADATSASVNALAGEVAVLKASFGTSETSADAHLTELVAQVNRAEKAESDLATRLARLEKPEVTSAVVSREITGSMQPATPPIAEGWVLWRVYNGRAVVRSRRGYFDVVPGVDLPDLGLVREITQRDGGWVVITQNGTIVPAPGHPLG